jgi:hypothetical protein
MCKFTDDKTSKQVKCENLEKKRAIRGRFLGQYFAGCNSVYDPKTYKN